MCRRDLEDVKVYFQSMEFVLEWVECLSDI
jgi:hypothetical protein